MALRITQGTRSPSVTDTLTVDGVAFDLTGSTVRFRMRAVGSAVLKVDSPATIVSAAAGTVRYDWAAVDVDTPGDYLAWWQVTLPSLKVQDHPEFAVDIQQHARAAGHLCEVAEVREAMESANREADSVIEALIEAASVAITKHASREFTPTAAGVTRIFRGDGHLIDLAPYDLQAASAVTDTPVGGTATTLVAGTDYDLDGPYLGGTYLYLRRPSTWTRSANGFGYSRLAVTGTWGMAVVPADVRQACVVTVRSWLRRDAAVPAFATLDDGRGIVPGPAGGWMLPMAAKQLLEPYRRVVV